MEITAETLCPQVSPQDPPPSPEVVTPAEILRRAAYRVGQPGAWCQHVLTIIRGGIHSYCILGTLEAEIGCLTGVAITQEWRDSIFRAVEIFIPETSWIAWNDRPERTQDEVVTALIRASELLEAETEAQ